MKAVKVALAILIFTVVLVLANSFFLSHTVNGYREKVSAINSEDTKKPILLIFRYTKISGIVKNI